MGIYAEFVGLVIGTLYRFEKKLDRLIQTGEITLAGIDDIKTQVARLITDAAAEMTAVQNALKAAASNPQEDADLEALAKQAGDAADKLESFSTSITAPATGGTTTSNPPAPGPTPPAGS